MPLDWSVVRKQAAAGRVAPLLRASVARTDTAGGPGRRAVAAAGTDRTLAERLAAVPAPRRTAELVTMVREHVATVLGHDAPAVVDPDRALKEMGFDSLTAVELRNRLNQVTGLRLPASLVFDYATIDAIAGYLSDEIGQEFGAESLGAELDRFAGARRRGRAPIRP